MSENSATPAKRADCLSMTGYAQARGDLNGWALRVSVKSVNHRFLDLKIRLPEGFDLFEIRLRQTVRERIARGHVDVYVGVEPASGAPVQVNRDLLQSYLRAAEELHKETPEAADVDVVALLRLPGVIGGLAPQIPESEQEQEKLSAALDRCLRDALARLDDMRRAEGRHLASDLRARAARIAGLTEQVRDLATKLMPAFARRLESRLKELLATVAIDPARIAQEAALLAQRSDISEELDRLRSHLQQFAKLLDGAGELGKKLDFLLQEMHREANTMLSKTPGVESEALAITGLALEIKAEIEKLREQVQNIE
ncbi:MAG TPA: YicC/YloC family endoribonuclease [Candidatus Dormibacteraeota bacterium]|nr:YicC/YloC family endoribonuclease [Candidatus Dormibacteraeota bacterium]